MQSFRVTPYFDQLDAMALLAGVELRDAFEAAGVPSSTYYRSLHGADLRVETANKVAGTIRLHMKRKPADNDPASAQASRSVAHSLV